MKLFEMTPDPVLQIFSSNHLLLESRAFDIASLTSLFALLLKATLTCSISLGSIKQNHFYNIKFKHYYYKIVHHEYKITKDNKEAYLEVAPHCSLSTSMSKIGCKRVMIQRFERNKLTTASSHLTKVMQAHEVTQHSVNLSMTSCAFKGSVNLCTSK
jgi:hypothetical protein